MMAYPISLASYFIITQVKCFVFLRSPYFMEYRFANCIFMQRHRICIRSIYLFYECIIFYHPSWSCGYYLYFMIYFHYEILHIDVI
jgi:hypothetical protein